jgi:hypothetical protein
VSAHFGSPCGQSTPDPGYQLAFAAPRLAPYLRRQTKLDARGIRSLRTSGKASSPPYRAIEPAHGRLTFTTSRTGPGTPSSNAQQSFPRTPSPIQYSRVRSIVRCLNSRNAQQVPVKSCTLRMRPCPTGCPAQRLRIPGTPMAALITKLMPLSNSRKPKSPVAGQSRTVLS